MPIEKRLLVTAIIEDGLPIISPDDLAPHLGKIKIIDVRRPDEFNNELGHIPGAQLLTMGPQLIEWLKLQNPEEEIVFVCRSGARSGAVTLQALHLGLTLSYNMRGGMVLWNQRHLPVERYS